MDILVSPEGVVYESLHVDPETCDADSLRRKAVASIITLRGIDPGINRIE